MYNIHMNDNQTFRIIAMRVFIFIVGIFQAALYTPFVISLAFFIIFIPVLFQHNLTNPLLSLFPQGEYNTARLLAVYGKYAFVVSLTISFGEMLLKKRFNISLRKKLAFASIVLVIGYGLAWASMTYKFGAPKGWTALVMLLLSLFALAGISLVGLLTAVTKFLEKAFTTTHASKPEFR